MNFELIMQGAKTVLVVVICLLLVRLSQKLQRQLIARGWLPPTLGLIAGSMSRWLAILVCGLMVLDIYGMPLKTIWAGLLSITLVVAVAFFASWSVLSNIFSSILLLTFSRIRVGDVVELRDTRRDETGVRGRVVDINAFFVTLEELEVDSEFGHKPPLLQIPSHFFFYRVTRHWEGEDTQALLDVFDVKNPGK